MRPLLLSLLVVLSFAPLAAEAASGNFFGPIVPEFCRSCDTAPGYGCVLQTLQNVVRFAISIGFVLAIFAFIYAGFTWMTSGGKPEKRTKGKNLLLNTFVGIGIMLSAWLIIDFVMKELYNGETSGFGPWNSILAGNGSDQCLVATTPVPLTSGTVDIVTSPSGSYSPGGGGSGSNCPAASPSGMKNFPAEVTQGGTEAATPSTVDNFLSMRAAALKDNIDLKVTDGFRPESEQVSLWNNRANIGAVAQPCSLGGNGSNHNSGVAIDINVGCGNGNANCNTKTYQWLKANGGRWGFKNAIPSDPLHWSPSGR